MLIWTEGLHTLSADIREFIWWDIGRRPWILCNQGRRLVHESTDYYRHHADEIPELVLYIIELGGRNRCLSGFLILHPCADRTYEGRRSFRHYNDFYCFEGRPKELKDHACKYEVVRRSNANLNSTEIRESSRSSPFRNEQILTRPRFESHQEVVHSEMSFIPEILEYTLKGKFHQ